MIAFRLGAACRALSVLLLGSTASSRRLHRERVQRVIAFAELLGWLLLALISLAVNPWAGSEAARPAN